MYGQTNSWALPEGKYGAYRGLGGEVYIMTARAALNLSYQVGRVAHGQTKAKGAIMLLQPIGSWCILSCNHRRWSRLQEQTPVRGEPECLLELTGQDLMGVPLSAPNSPHERVYVLPLLTILTNKARRRGVGSADQRGHWQVACPFLSWPADIGRHPHPGRARALSPACPATARTTTPPSWCAPGLPFQLPSWTSIREAG